MRLVRFVVRGIFIICAGIAVTSPLAAQPTVRPGASDSAVFRRAQQMITNGNAAGARALVDSVVGAAREGTPIFVEALYWQAVFSDSPEATRKGYLRIVVEFGSSPRAEQSLLRLAQLELSRGGKASARRHLERLALEHPDGATRAQGAYFLGRALLDDGMVARGCASLSEAKQRASAGDVELQNQISYGLRACGTVQLAADSVRQDSLRADSIKTESLRLAAAQADALAKRRAVRPAAKAAAPVTGQTTAPVAAPVPKPVLPTPTAPPPAAASTGRWTVQVAAYQVRTDADKLMAKLKARGLDARVTDDRPYRVRIGWYATHAEAADVVEKLRGQQMTAIVMEAEKP